MHNRLRATEGSFFRRLEHRHGGLDRPIPPPSDAFHRFGRARADREKILRSRASGCVSYGSARRSLRMTISVACRSP